MKATLFYGVATIAALLAPTVIVRAQDVQFASLADPNSLVYFRQARDHAYPFTLCGADSSADTAACVGG